jgi:hypothetical protein
MKASEKSKCEYEKQQRLAEERHRAEQHRAEKRQRAKQRQIAEERQRAKQRQIAEERQRAEQCIFFMKGNCRYDDECRFSHSVARITPLSSKAAVFTSKAAGF